ncbi:MAG: tmoS [Holophagaceae bacterium]|nr:tmoS [Holophagaceae bacterium]
MKLDVPTLVFILGLIFMTLLVPLSVQFRVNRAYRGIGYWLLGSVLTACGFVFLAGTGSEAFGFLGLLGNPLLMGGRMCILVGVSLFLERRISPLRLASSLTAFVVLYYVYLFAVPNVSARTVVVSTAIALYSFMAAYLLLVHRPPEFKASARFTACVFLAHGCFLLLNIYDTLQATPIDSYLDFSTIQKAAFVVPIVTSPLWTFGLILMVNQRLNAENIAEKQKLQNALGALKDSEETYRSILNASPDDITITDREGKVLIMSPAAWTMFGYEPQEGADLEVLNFLAPEDRERGRSNLSLMLQGSLKGPNEYKGMRLDGSTFDIEVNSGFIRGPHGQPAKLVFVIRDISARKKAEFEKAELETKNRQLQKAESLGRMAGAISHHFNNKLQSVISNLELLEHRPRSADPGILLGRARQAAEGATEVSRLMLAYLGQTSYEQAPLNLTDFYQGALPLLQGILPPQVSLETEFRSAVPAIMGNGDQLQQVMINLVTNAWEAMGGEGGAVHLALRTCMVSEIPTVNRFPVSWQPQAVPHVCLEVSDSGPGIPEGHLEKLFDPFFSTRHAGRGMGLPVVLGLVQAHGGGLSVQSRPGEGSVFRAYFPACKQALLPTSETAAPGVDFKGTLLLVDDDAPLLEATGDLLEAMGFTPLTARDGLEALERFQAHRAEIRCVITDLTMPRLDGWGTLSALRQIDPSLPVILASGYDQGHVLAGHQTDRPNAFLGKPFSMSQLKEALTTALAGPD